MKIRIYYEDTDMGGVVYHTNYIKYCERARSEMFFQSSLSPAIDGCHFVVKELYCDFKSFAILGDMVDVTTEIIEIKSASLKLIQRIYKDKKEIFRMNITLVFLCQDGKISKIPPNIREFFKLNI
jgi:acyl-CoA thioester hydrolase